MYRTGRPHLIFSALDYHHARFAFTLKNVRQSERKTETDVGEIFRDKKRIKQNKKLCCLKWKTSFKGCPGVLRSVLWVKQWMLNEKILEPLFSMSFYGRFDRSCDFHRISRRIVPIYIINENFLNLNDTEHSINLLSDQKNWNVIKITERKRHYITPATINYTNFVS